MIAAEAGVDYVMFGDPDARGARPSLAAIAERVAWWSELFEIPCVAYAEQFGDMGELCAAGADFIAIGEPAFADPQGCRLPWRRRARRSPHEISPPASRWPDHNGLPPAWRDRRRRAAGRTASRKTGRTQTGDGKETCQARARKTGCAQTRGGREGACGNRDTSGTG